jgi:rubrerythrin
MTLANTTKIPERTQRALIEALVDERSAEALYRAVLDRYGPVRPFINIIESERRHQQRLLELFRDYGVPIPPASAEPAELADSLAAECRRAIEAERENIAMYDRFLEDVREPDIRRVFSNLQAASRDNHLPAFERCARREERHSRRR